jgi:hypothetical protein
MTSKLIKRLVNESSGKNLAAEIYSEETGYTVSYFINGAPAASTHMNADLNYVQNEAQNWLNNVKVIYG